MCIYASIAHTLALEDLVKDGKLESTLSEKFLIIKRPEGKHAGGLLAFHGGKVEEIDEHSEWDILRFAAKREILEAKLLQ